MQLGEPLLQGQPANCGDNYEVLLSTCDLLNGLANFRASFHHPWAPGANEAYIANGHHFLLKPSVLMAQDPIDELER
jgi:hypothetical protein